MRATRRRGPSEDGPSWFAHLESIGGAAFERSFELGHLRAAPKPLDELRRLVRLEQHRVGQLRVRAPPQEVAVARDEDSAHERMRSCCALEQRNAVHARHLQIGTKDVELASRQMDQRFGAAPRSRYSKVILD